MRSPTLGLALFLGGAIAIVFATSSASAQSRDGEGAYAAEVEPTGWLARPLVVEAQLAGSGPLGTAGAAIEYTPIAGATISGGVGLGQGRAQAAILPRLHQPLTETLGIGIGAGISVGPSGPDGRDALRRVFCASCGDLPERTYALAWWGNAEISLEERRPWGLVWRLFVGGARILNPGDGVCAPGGCVDHPTEIYAGAALGWSFAL